MTEIILGLIIAGIIIERYFFAREITKQLDSCMKALISKNANEYLSMKSVDNQAKEKPEKEPEGVYLDQADEETFNKFIKTTQ